MKSNLPRFVRILSMYSASISMGRLGTRPLFKNSHYHRNSLTKWGIFKTCKSCSSIIISNWSKLFCRKLWKIQTLLSSKIISASRLRFATITATSITWSLTSKIPIIFQLYQWWKLIRFQGPMKLSRKESLIWLVLFQPATGDWSIPIIKMIKSRNNLCCKPMAIFGG